MIDFGLSRLAAPSGFIAPMKKSRLLVLALAIAAAGGAFVMANAPKPAVVEAQAPPPVPTDEVLTASHDLPIGTVVADADIGWQAWPKAALAAGMLVRAADPTAADTLKGSIVRIAFFAGEPIHREKLIKGSGFMSALLPSGRRAVAINIDSGGSTTAGGFILPNDRVDVVHTYQDQSKAAAGAQAAPVISETLLHNIRVLAIGQNVQDKNGQAVVVGSNATLELEPAQAETIILAQRVGQLSLTLRSVLDQDKDTADTEKVDKSMTVVRYGNTAAEDIR